MDSVWVLGGGGGGSVCRFVCSFVCSFSFLVVCLSARLSFVSGLASIVTFVVKVVYLLLCVTQQASP